MIGQVSRELLSEKTVGFLDPVESPRQVVETDGAVFECHRHLGQDRVDLRPVDPLQGGQCPLGCSGDVLTVGKVHAPHRQVCAARSGLHDASRPPWFTACEWSSVEAPKHRSRPSS